MRRQPDLKYIGRLPDIKSNKENLLSDVDAYGFLMFGTARRGRTSFSNDSFQYMQVSINRTQAWHVAYQRHGSEYKKICDLVAKPCVIKYYNIKSDEMELTTHDGKIVKLALSLNAQPIVCGICVP